MQVLYIYTGKNLVPDFSLRKSVLKRVSEKLSLVPNVITHVNRKCNDFKF